MFSVALIGGDGAGKTTVANAIIQSSGLPMKYLYMGLSTRSSNHALPTSRLVLFIKRLMYKKASNQQVGDIPANELEYSEKSHGWLWNTARFLNRLAEAWYRQVISMYYQVRGFVPVYDRHFFFDSAPGVINSQSQSLLMFDRLFFWLMCHMYPRPSLAIFLDAPPDLLYQRKGEATPDYLEQQRLAFLEQGRKLAHFVQVDASQPLEKVIGVVLRVVQDFQAQQSPHSTASHPPEKVGRK